jgi:regulator of protease activity HflC (stomatin/prohibitin superfamily)
MAGLIAGTVVAVVLTVVFFTLAVHIVQQYEKGVVFRFGRVVGEKSPGTGSHSAVRQRTAEGLVRVVTMPIQFQGITIRDNVSVDVSALS